MAPRSVVSVVLCLLVLVLVPKPAAAQSQPTSDACNTSHSPHQNYRTQSTLMVQANGTVSPNLYIGIEHKGVFRSTDGGATWVRSNTGLRGYPLLGSESESCIRELGRIVADPGNPARLFLLRVETPGRLDMMNSETGGIYRSTDAGQTWTQLTGYGNAGGGHGLAVVAGTQPTVFMGVGNSPASWAGAPPGFYNTTGVIYRSVDGGNTWTELDQRAGTAVIEDYLAASQVFTDATGQRIWATAMVRSSTGAMAPDTAQIGYFESSDGGATWTRGASRLSDPVTDPSGRAAINGDVAPTHFDHRFLAATNTPTSPQAFSWYTLDGQLWRKTSRYVYVARYSPHDSNGLTLFGYDPFSGSPAEPQQGILKSVDGGATWTRIGALPPGVDNESNGVRVSQFAFHPTDPQTIYAGGSYGYVWRSTDGGVSWSVLLNVDTPVVGGPNLGTPTVPGAPGKPTVAAGTTSATVSWTAPTTGGLPSSYVVEVSTDATFATNVSQTSATARSATVTLPTAAQRVYIRVRGIRDGVGAGAYSDTMEVPFPVATPADLRFGATKAGASGALVSVTGAQVVTTTFAPGVTWTVSEDLAWLSIADGAGTGPGRFVVAVVNPDNVIGGSTTLSGSIIVSASSLGLSVSLPVTLTVDQTNTATVAPFGVFDTPLDNSTVSGSLAVTGWALDDVGIDRVEIWRDRITNDPAPPFLQTGHPASGKVFIANGTFVEGTRTDVEAFYPTMPARNRAGWGYLLLTQGFPNANGTFVLTAIAWDKEGKFTVLGTKTIVVNNATSTKPFGSIDVPAYGATFSGHQFTFGWALTPNLGCTMSSGRVYMTIDSAPPMFPVTYGANRTDIAGAFPGLQDSNGAGGAVALNSLNYTNGTHQIGWLVYDSCDNGEGIGSRFFTILNSGARPLQRPASATGDELAAPRDLITGTGPAFGRTTLPDVPMSPETLWLVRGMGTTETPLAAGSKVWLSQTGRIEVHATRPDVAPMNGLRYEGYLVANGELRALPLGSSFDATRGSFFWQPVAGFLGTYEIRIVQLRGDTPELMWSVPVEVGPEADGALLQIDATDGVIRGWAIDPQATDGSGIGHVHAWIVQGPTGSTVQGSPRFVGAASLGQHRLDVGNRYGRQFDASGFALALPADLPQGVYDVVVYAWSVRTGSWSAVQTVHLKVR